MIQETRFMTTGKNVKTATAQDTPEKVIVAVQISDGKAIFVMSAGNTQTMIAKPATAQD